MITKNQFKDFIKNYQYIDRRMSEAENNLGFELSGSGIISDLYSMIYDLLFKLFNCNEDKDLKFFDDLGKLLYINKENNSEELEEFYNKYYKGVKA